MDRKHDAFSIVCHNFSDIRRRPLVIGKLDQVRLPFVVTMPQLAVGALTFGLLFVSRPIWGAVMSDRLHIVTFVVAPIVVAQQVSRTSIEGRTVSKAALGFVRLWLAPRNGEINGRRRRPAASEPIRLTPLIPVRVEAVRPQARSAAISSRPVTSPPVVPVRIGALGPRTTMMTGHQPMSRRTQRRYQRQAGLA